MSRPYVGIVFAALACFLASTASPALAQQPAISANPYRGNGIYAPPGHYGVMFGTPSYGTVRTTSAFSSPFGVGYGYGYPAARILPGRHGAGLWRSDLSSPGSAYGASDSSYRTFPVPYAPRGAYTPPLGVYAPTYGPSYPGW